MPPSQNSHHGEHRESFIASLAQGLAEARSLGELKHLYMSAINHVYRILGPRIGPNERPEERELRETFRVTYTRIHMERRRAYQRSYMRRWRAANLEKARAQNRRAARTHRELVKLIEAAGNYIDSSSLT